MDTKTRPMYMLFTEAHFRPRDTYRLKVRGCKNIFHVNGNQRKAGVTIFISDKIDFIFLNFILSIFFIQQVLISYPF